MWKFGARAALVASRTCNERRVEESGPKRCEFGTLLDLGCPPSPGVAYLRPPLCHLAAASQRRSGAAMNRESPARFRQKRSGQHVGLRFHEAFEQALKGEQSAVRAADLLVR